MGPSPTPPTSENDIYPDPCLTLLYEPSDMHESRLPPVLIENEPERQHIDPVISASTTTRKQKVPKVDMVNIPISLFDQPSAAILKLRRKLKSQKIKGLRAGASFLRKPVPTFAGLKQPPAVINRLAPDVTQDKSEWLISEDYEILQVIQDHQGIPLNLAILIPGHIPNWDLAADAVNDVRRVYRSAINCKARFENVIMLREGKFVYGNNPKKTQGIHKRKNNRSMKTSQLYQQDNNAAYTNVFRQRCKTVMKLAQAKSVKVQTQMQKILEGSSYLNDCGINYDEPLSPMEIASNRQERIQRRKQEYQLKKHGDTMKITLENCTLATFYDYNTTILPNSIQLIETELPLSEATNCEELQGIYLFRQIFSSYDDTFQCLFCRNKCSLCSPADLEKHYHDVHELAVNTSQASFNSNTVFASIESDVYEETTVNSTCRFCDATLKTLAAVRDHYANAHNLTVRLLLESDVDEMRKFFYCGLCCHASADFPSHHQHMKVMHRMQTYVCPYCTYCTHRLSHLQTHVKQRHLQDQPGSHLQCSVYVQGKDGLTKHMLSHALQTGNGDFREVDRNNSVDVFSQTNEQANVWELHQHLKVILLNGNVSDVVLKVEDQEFKAHKCILAARSPVFVAMMTHETQEKNTDIVDIEDVDPGIFLDFLSYLYTGNMGNVTSQNAVELYTVADKYQVDELKHVCLDCMLKTISIDNFCDIVTLSLRHGQKELTDACSQFFIENSFSIALTLKWQMFLSENPVVSIDYIKQLQMKK